MTTYFFKIEEILTFVRIEVLKVQLSKMNFHENQYYLDSGEGRNLSSPPHRPCHSGESQNLRKIPEALFLFG